ncbi:MAG: hypothetical protein ACOVP6_07690 [Lacibacter sp.]
MNQHSETYKELFAISPLLAQQKKVNPFSVPDNYFETNTVVLFDVATSNESFSGGPLSGIKDMNTLKIPETYFEQLPDIILKRIRQTETETENQELQSISPLVASIPKTNVFTTSPNYFDEALATISTKTIHKQTTRVHSFKHQFAWTHFAAAATLFFMMTFGAFYLLKQNKTSNDSVVSTAMQIRTEEQFETLLAQVNESDIIHYLQISADIKDAETIRSMVNSNQLPEESDYFNTEIVDTFLNDLNTNVTTNN